MKNKLKIVGVVCHDSGGAEIVSSYIKQKKITPVFCLDGPAISIFERKLGKINNLSLSDLLKQSDWLLCGTSWQSDLEWSAIKEAKKKNKKVISFLDHWINYRSRFFHNNELLLPDEIWVGDESAFRIASNEFSNTLIIMKKNYSFIGFRREFSLVEKEEKYSLGKHGIKILFLSDNIAESLEHQFGDQNLFNYTDRSSFEYFYNNRLLINHNIIQITIRLHPSEKPTNFNWAISLQYPQVVKSNAKNLIEDFIQHDVVVGSDSMAMALAIMCKKRVVCSIPPKGRVCSLPFDEIEMLRDLIK